MALQSGQHEMRPAIVHRGAEPAVSAKRSRRIKEQIEQNLESELVCLY
jgi:hypothetical protein